MDTTKSVLKRLKKDGISHSCTYLGATPLYCHTALQERYTVALGDTQNICLGEQLWVAPHTDPFRKWFILLEGFWRNQRLRDDHHRVVVFLFIDFHL